MAKEQAEKQEPVAPKGGFIRLVRKLFVWGVLIGAGVYLAQNPQVLEHFSVPQTGSVADNNLQEELNSLQQQIYSLRQNIPDIDLNQLEKLDERFDALEKNNLNIIDSKADVAALMGMTTRIDKLEAALEKAVKITDEGALVLTAVMLVKDSADQGGVFEYEAEILQQITAENPSLKEPVAEIIRLAKSGISSRAYLQYSFADVYNQLKKKQQKAQEESLSWKERVNAKLGELVQVKKTNVQEKEAEVGLEMVKRLVESGELSNAVKELQLTANAPLLSNPALEKWYKQALERENFDKAVSRIAASSLALMKVNFIKKSQ